MATPARLFFLTLLTLTLAAGAALANAKKKRRPYLRNCTGQRVHVCVYDGKDRHAAVPSQDRVLEKGERLRLKCKGQGRKRCRYSVVPKKYLKGKDKCGLAKVVYEVRFKQSVKVNWARRSGELSYSDWDKDKQCP